VIPAHNAAATIARALESVRAQAYAPLEVIVVDDASGDDTAGVVRAWRDPPVRLIVHETNRGPAAARNTGIFAAEGDWIAFLDADDEWRPGKLDRQVAALGAGPGAVFAVCDGRFIRPDGSVGRFMYTGTPPVAGTEAWRTLLAYSFTDSSCVVADRRTLVALGGFDPDLRVGEDQDMWIRLAMAGSVVVLSDRLVDKRESPTSHMARHTRAEATQLMGMVERHVRHRWRDLGRREARAILGARCTEIGRNAYAAGAAGTGARLLLKAIRYGDRRLGNALFLAHASPPGRRLKRAVRALRRPSAG
jgi:glycosyltransferase involved in cell wall biosynthesis